MREHTVTADLAISFQRYPYPPPGWIKALPRSRGALPLAVATPERLVLPSPPGEAFWIGLVATPRGPSFLVHALAILTSGEQIDLATATAPDDHYHGGGFEVPPRFAIEGIPRQDGTWWALTGEAPGPPAPTCAALELQVSTAASLASPTRVRVDLVDPVRFEAFSGEPVPAALHDDETYGGWRLP
jgi:hypothetical protein